MLIELNKKKYNVCENEFNIIPHKEYNNLSIHENCGYYERIASLLNELRLLSDTTTQNLSVISATHGGFLPIECSKFFKNVFMYLTDNTHALNIYFNLQNHDISNVIMCDSYENKTDFLLFSENITIGLNQFLKSTPILLAPLNDEILNSKIYSHVYNLTNTNLYLYIPDKYLTKFKSNFVYFIKKDKLDYDNLIHLCIMVKNGGDQFERMLINNLPIIDRWTILDTGSTDNTIDIIKKVLIGKKKGELYQEPFINFGDSRNRCLDLAGQVCKFTCMLDDTYYVEDELRDFLNIVRGDQFADSFSLFIKSNDNEYVSNRVVKTDRKLRYLYKIHESITFENNKNVIIPITKSRIFDFRCDYMEKRTNARKEEDLKLLFEELYDNNNTPRQLYYIAQTYNLLGNNELAYEYYLKRVNHPDEGYLQEKIDACFEAARKANFELNMPWEHCEELYLKSYNMDQTRPESLYFIGIHYHFQNNQTKAYENFKKAFELGYPVHAQYSLKPTLSYHFLPKLLVSYCYLNNNFILGEQVTTLFLQKNNPDADGYSIIASWHNIFINLNKMKKLVDNPFKYHKPYFCFVADGGFTQWSGRDILTKGIGGSETYIIEMSRYIQQNEQFQVLVFCNCENIDVFEGVIYYPINKYFEFVCDNHIHSCIVSRYSEYLPVSFKGNVENVYMVLHDLTPSGQVIPIDPKLKKIFCLTEWHVDYMSEQFPSLKHLLVPFYYGIDFNKFNSIGSKITKIPYKFIYSSFPNRGLLQLLQMWPKIYKREPRATLHIYSDINGEWVNKVEPAQMTLIKDLIDNLKGMNIYYYGWVSKQELSVAWLSSDIWFYPCTFMETFCLTALEAALTKTLAVCSNLASLQNTVSDRGVLIDGNPTSEIWQDEAIGILFNVIQNVQLKNDLLKTNYLWAKNLSWEKQANLLLDKFINNENNPNNTINENNSDNAINENNSDNAINENNSDNAINENNPNNAINEQKYNDIKILINYKLKNKYNIQLLSILNFHKNNVLDYLNYENIQNITKIIDDTENIIDIDDNISEDTKTTTIKGNPVIILNKLNNKYDLIYIELVNKNLFDIYTNIYLSWQLLNSNGIMLIAKYDNNELFNAFISKIKDESNYTSFITSNMLIIGKK